MEDILEIPELGTGNLMELTVCGRLNSRSPSVKEKLGVLRDGMTARIGNRRSNKYIEIFGTGRANNHLHIDTVIRPPGWAATKTLRPLADVQKAVMQFSGVPVDLTIEGEFFVSIEELPEEGLIRSAIVPENHHGLTARQTAQSLDLSLSNSMIRHLKWEEIDKKFFFVGLAVRDYARINSEYLRNCESLVIEAFNAVILEGKANAASHR